MSARYDLFVSYAREDGGWVKANLYDPLLLCRTHEGRRPRVFFDVGEEGIEPGRNWVTALEEALKGSGRIVAVYSSAYFLKPWCEWELTKAFELDPTGGLGKLVPVLMERGAASQVPMRVSHINFIAASQADWFERLCQRLELAPPQKPAELQFLDQPADAVTNLTLPALRVVLAGAEPSREEEVTLTCDRALLTGTIRVRSSGGVASFTDLCVSGPVSEARLLATADGCIAATSRSFAVRAPDARPSPSAEEAQAIPGAGEAVFFEDGRALAVLRPDPAIDVYDLAGRSLATVKLRARPRLLRRAGDALVAADWSGDVNWLASDGRHAHWSLGEAGWMAFCVPGALELTAEGIDVGLWSGRLVRLVPGEQEPVRSFTHSGVQGLARVGERLYVCALDGTLACYEGERRTATYGLERGVRLLKAYASSVVAVGECRLYQLSLDRPSVLDEMLHIGPVTAVLGEAERPVVVDAQGKGLCFDSELVLRWAFHAPAGAVPVSADRGARLCVLRHPDGTRGLMVEGRVVLTHAGGTLALSADGGTVAAGEGGHIRVLAGPAAQELLAGARG